MQVQVDLQDLVNYVLYYATQKDIKVNVFYLCEILYESNGSFVREYGCSLCSVPVCSILLFQSRVHANAQSTFCRKN